MEIEENWQQDVRNAILEVTKELDVQASVYGPIIYFSPVQGVVAELSVFWYDGILGYGFIIDWPANCIPSIDYFRELARAKIKAIQDRIARADWRG